MLDAFSEAWIIQCAIDLPCWWSQREVVAGLYWNALENDGERRSDSEDGYENCRPCKRMPRFKKLGDR
jgi:hypothetical protein